MASRIAATKRLTQKAVAGKKPKSWPGGMRATAEYKTKAAQLRNIRKGKQTVSKYAKRTTRAYRPVDQSKGPAIYSRTDVYDTLYRFGGFQAGQHYEIADFACGKGLVGAKVAALVHKNGADPHVTFMDLGVKTAVIQKQMAEDAPSIRFEIKDADVRKIAAPNNKFDRTFCRFAIKNMQPDQQLTALKEIARVTKKGGIFVLNDMVSPSNLQEFQNAERRAKAISAGGKASHHVPTEQEWVRRLQQAGFKVEEVEYTMSTVHTGDWVSSGQATEKGLRSYGQFLEQSKGKWPAAWNEYQIKQKTDPKKGAGYEIIYPVVYIRCQKI